MLEAEVDGRVAMSTVVVPEVVGRVGRVGVVEVDGLELPVVLYRKA